MRDDSLQATPILARNSGLNEGTHFADFDSRLIFKKNQTQIQIASLVEEIVIYGQLWGSELVDLNFHLEVIQLCWRWTLGKKKQMENDLVSVCLVRQCQYVPIG